MPGGDQTLHRAHRQLSFAIALLLAVVALFARIPKAAGSSPGTLYVAPSPLSVAAGDTVFVAIGVSGASDIHAIEFTLGYDPSVVQVNDAVASAPGTQILSGPFPGSPSDGSVVRNSAGAGVLDYEYDLNPGLTRSGSGAVATAQLTALASGDARLTWLAASFIDASGARVTPQLVIGAPLVPAATVAATATATPPDPTSSPIPQPTATDAAPTDTTVATVTRTLTPVGSTTATRTPVPPKATPSPKAPATAAVGSRSRAPAPGQGNPAQVKGTQALPAAGSNDHGISWWRWIFFLAAILFGVSSWFFTFAFHHGQREVILVDRFSRRRHRR